MIHKPCKISKKGTND